MFRKNATPAHPLNLCTRSDQHDPHSYTFDDLGLAEWATRNGAPQHPHRHPMQ